MRRSLVAAIAAVALVVGATVVGVSVLSDDGGEGAVPDCSAPAADGYENAAAVDGMAPAVEIEWLVPMEGAIAMAATDGDPTIYAASILGTVTSIDESGSTAVVLDLTEEVNVGENESGLLDIAISPNGESLYVSYTDLDRTLRVDEWELSSEGVLDGSRRNVIEIEKENSTHNAGGLQFGPDGLLFFSVGDGEIERDEPGGEASDLSTPMGKILRVDPTPTGELGYTIPEDNPYVDDEEVEGEVWVSGLRNPWRFSFDAVTGDLWVGDVGQWCWEEINHVTASEAAGADFGWNYYEGGHLYEGGGDEPATSPVWEGAHATGDCAVVGGYVYRGADIPELEGSYVFSDFCRPEMRTLTPVSGGYEYNETGIDLPGFLTFAEGAGNELYVLSTSDGVGRLVPASSAVTPVP